MKIVITGGSGYLGSRLIQELHEQGFDGKIKVIGRFLSTDKKKFLKIFPHCEVLKKDILDISSQDLEGYDVIVHLAAIANVSQCDANKAEATKVNIIGTHQLYTAAVEAKVGHFIFMSTLGIYEYLDNGKPKIKNLRPITHYSRTKILAEKHLFQLQDKTTSISIIRSAVLFGFSPAFRSDLLVNSAVLCAVNKTSLVCHGNGDQLRPLIHIKDVCNHIITLIHEKKPKKYKVQAIYKEDCSVQSVLKTVSELFKVKISFLPQKFSRVSYRAVYVKDCELKNDFNICVSEGVFRLKRRFSGE